MCCDWINWIENTYDMSRLAPVLEALNLLFLTSNILLFAVRCTSLNVFMIVVSVNKEINLVNSSLCFECAYRLYLLIHTS
jgi:hypothetical protein